MKPFKWYIYKPICEAGYKLRNITSFGWDIYYWALHKLCKTGYNLYGQKIEGHSDSAIKAITLKDKYGIDFAIYSTNIMKENIEKEFWREVSEHLQRMK